MIKVNDVMFDSVFIAEYENAPDKIQRRFTRKMDMILEAEMIPNSFQAHRIHVDLGLWEGYINQGNGGWRVLFEVDASGCLHFLHIQPHDDMMRTIAWYVRNA